MTTRQPPAPVRIKQYENDWYVFRGSDASTEYLHADGQWRKSTFTMVGEEKMHTAYFPTKEAASKNAFRAGYTITETAASH